MKKLFVFIMIVFCAMPIFAQKDLELDKPINPDPKVKIGKLDNGLTYYIRENSYPKEYLTVSSCICSSIMRITA